ncbi:MAG: 2-oxo acid dehydrogenase subunit E2, partial [Pseudomonadales bacterium]|nr:2-oxo acid dehydrogenase subunit E2 [Pseudomonadales bacterium]
MTIEIKAPTLPESVPDGTIATWHKNLGDKVKRDELLVDIETDKVVIEVVSPVDGTLTKIYKDTGDTIVSNEAIGAVKEGDADEKQSAEPEAGSQPDAPEQPVPESAAAESSSTEEPVVSPAARKLIEENNLSSGQITGSGKGGRITKEDVLSRLESGATGTAAPAQPAFTSTGSGRVEERVPMSRLRAKVAERLLQATQSTAMLTTFNEVNMKPIMDLRGKYKELFEKTHQGSRLGFMSFFVRSCVEALKKFPAVNASIDGNDI